MPFTHVEIEERTSRTITLLFLFLIVLYAVSLVALVGGIKFFLGVERADGQGWERHLLTPMELAQVFAASLAFGGLHWVFSTHRLFERVLTAVGGRPLDARDRYHAMLSNIVQEVSIATGGRSIESYVLQTPAVNACAWTDFTGRAAIAVTEGALARLNRAQLESVIGHEAAHVVSGESLTTSVFCGLFALHEEALKRLANLLDSRDDARGKTGGRLGAMVFFAWAVLQATVGMKKLCEMLISREKEYRADAVAVRLTRNPLALAEALSILSSRWRGVGTRGESLSSIFIMDPGVESFSEREGFFAEWFSTHPPTERRIGLLLGMAHLDPERFSEQMSATLRRSPPRALPAPVRMDQQRPPVDGESPRWMVWEQGQWIGPFGLAELEGTKPLTPDSWTRRIGEEVTRPAHQDALLLDALRRRYAKPAEAPHRTECPRCRLGLVAILYEGTPIDECPACHGCYVDPDIMAKLFCRQEYDVPESVKRLGETLLSEQGSALARQHLRAKRQLSAHRSCPRCGASVLRKYYTDAYPVEVEQCWECGLAWLDHQERELLQYLYEQRERHLLNEHGPGERPPDF
jgi:heat shock protein HtpX